MDHIPDLLLLQVDQVSLEEYFLLRVFPGELAVLTIILDVELDIDELTVDAVDL